jgi:hypothetical protein
MKEEAGVRTFQSVRSNPGSRPETEIKMILLALLGFLVKPAKNLLARRREARAAATG